jgi:hypothetical protein
VDVSWMNPHLQTLAVFISEGVVEIRTNGNCMSQTRKKARRTFDEISALSLRVLVKFCHELPKMQRSITERIDPP